MGCSEKQWLAWGVALFTGFSIDRSGQAATQAAANATGWTVPQRAERMSNPVPANAQSIAKGKSLYQQECVACHGKTGHGDGPKAPDLKVNPGDFSSPATIKQSDGSLFWKITRGRTPMPAYRSRFSDQERWMLVNYIRSVAGSEPAIANKPEVTRKETNAVARVAGPSTNTVPTIAPTNAPTLAQKPLVAEKVERREESNARTLPVGEQVSRKEYDALKASHEQLKQELENLKQVLQEQRQTAVATNAPVPAQVQEAIDGLSEEVEELREKASPSFPGSTKGILTGFASAGYSSRRHEDAAFSANFVPIFLWQLNERILFESELDIALENRTTDIDLVRAQISYLVNDYMTVGAGLFLSPMNFLEDRLHQVGKLPDRPVAIRELLPENNLGAQVRGGIPLGGTRLTYAVYAANAPTIEQENLARMGMLQFDNYQNIGGHVALGGRLGFYPIPELEIGYGFQFSGIGGMENGGSFLHSVDLNYVRDSELLKGTINFLAQWAWSDADDLTFDPDGPLGVGAARFENDRNGGYVQLAYRPTMVQNRMVNRLEPVIRYEYFDQANGVSDEERWTIGLNYWILPSAVLKAAYQFGERGDQDIDAILLQFKIGF